MFGTGHKEEAMLYYLYMMSDGEVSYSEEKLFNEICKELNLDEEEKQSAIVKSKEIAKDPKDALYAILREKLDEQVGLGIDIGMMDLEMLDLRLMDLGLKGHKNKSRLARIIWNLVNLGYADTYYSDEEKKIVNHLLEKWEIDKEVYREMVDTADAMLALTKQREWILSTFSKGSERDEK